MGKTRFDDFVVDGKKVWRYSRYHGTLVPRKRKREKRYAYYMWIQAWLKRNEKDMGL